jgi:hypothetical protein
LVVVQCTTTRSFTLCAATRVLVAGEPGASTAGRRPRALRHFLPIPACRFDGLAPKMRPSELLRSERAPLLKKRRLESSDGRAYHYLLSIPEFQRAWHRRCEANRSTAAGDVTDWWSAYRVRMSQPNSIPAKPTCAGCVPNTIA